jgi:hypothetical protein
MDRPGVERRLVRPHHPVGAAFGPVDLENPVPFTIPVEKRFWEFLIGNEIGGRRWLLTVGLIFEIKLAKLRIYTTVVEDNVTRAVRGIVPIDRGRMPCTNRVAFFSAAGQTERSRTVSYISAIKAERRSLSCMFLVACLGGKRGEMPKSRLQLAAFNRRTKKLLTTHHGRRYFGPMLKKLRSAE